MRKLVIALSISTVTLAAASLWLARETANQRAKNAEMPPAVTVTSTSHTAQPAAAKVMATPAALDAPPPPAAADPRPFAPPAPDYARKFLDSIATPEGRARVLADGRRSLASTYPPAVMERRGLTHAELDRFLDLKAELMFSYGETMARCNSTPGCDSMSTSSTASAEADQRLRNLLGTEKFNALKSYEDSLVERRTATRLRGQLPDSAYLSDDAVERLTTALAEERRRYQSENSTPDSAPSAIGTVDGMLYYMPQTTSDESLASAEEFARRTHRQAAAVLDRRQLAEFDEMQARVLAALREHLAGNEDATRARP